MPEYIDKTTLLKKLKKTPRYFDVKFDIEQMPVADVVEVKHGYWTYVYTGECLLGTDAPLSYKCSCCGEFATDPFGFCPNCGAKMEGGEEE